MHLPLALCNCMCLLRHAAEINALLHAEHLHGFSSQIDLMRAILELLRIARPFLSAAFSHLRVGSAVFPLRGVFLLLILKLLLF